MKPQRMVAEALVEPLAALGWQKRAWGWFTWPVHDGYLGVLALGSASEHTRPGSALIAPLIGLRHEEIEETVAELCDLKSDYRMRSVTGALGYQTPEKTYKEWLVDSPAVADQAAREITADVDRYGIPAVTDQLRVGPLGHDPSSSEQCSRVLPPDGRSRATRQPTHRRRRATHDRGQGRCGPGRHVPRPGCGHDRTAGPVAGLTRPSSGVRRLCGGMDAHLDVPGTSLAIARAAWVTACNPQSPTQPARSPAPDSATLRKRFRGSASPKKTARCRQSSPNPRAYRD